jgi:hypothetical protein
MLYLHGLGKGGLGLEVQGRTRIAALDIIGPKRVRGNVEQ